jgi:siderophore synthetase component
VRFAFRPVDPDGDAALLQGWLSHPKSAYWLMGDLDVAAVARYNHELAADPMQDAFVGLHDGEPVFLMERYDPRGLLADVYDVQPGDVGMHFLVAPTDTPVRGFTRAVITAIMDFLFADPAVARVVVEPDVRNTAVHELNRHVGFVPDRVVRLPEKDALLSFCRRPAAAGAGDAGPRAAGTDPAGAVEHLLDPALWERATRHLVRKALAEFAHERLLTPEPDGDAWVVAAGVVEYRFTAQRLALDHWHVDAGSIVRRRAGVAVPLDACEFFLEFRDQLGLTESVLPTYLEEITSTLAGAAFKLATAVPAKELARADFQAVEAGMTEGHPCFVANNGRLGFDAAEYRAYAPEAGRPVRLVWLAVRRDRSTFSCSPDLDHDSLMRAEGAPVDGVDLTAFHLLPVHPWQWWNRIAVTFAADIARGDIVCLGEGTDSYRAQQSVRTFFNTSRPDRHYVKTALSVLNMGFVRGLSAEYMAGTPAINDWVAGLVADDPVLRRYGFSVLRERAAIGYHATHYAAAAEKGSPYTKMLAALWRESPVPGLADGERLMTMAALLHVDPDGNPLVGELIAESGLPAREWLARYLDAYLAPLLHCLAAHRLVFMPHGENLILVLRDGVPVRAIMKDIGEEVAVLDPDTPLPPAVERIRAEVPDDLAALSILTDVVDCVFRFLSAILHTSGLLDQDDFWAEVARCVAEHPDPRHDLFADRFALSCLNRLQLRNNRQMVDLADPAGSLALVGELDNPLAPHRRTPR